MTGDGSSATAAAFATIDGKPIMSAHVNVGNGGPWYADVDMLDDAPVGDAGGRVTIKLGSLVLVGTIAPAWSGSFALQGSVRVVAGGGGWSRAIDARGYHNDAGVKARLIAEDAARAVGETLGDFVPAAERLAGSDYARQAGAASRALCDATGAGVVWWVGYDGITRAGPRAGVPLAADAYELLAYDPRSRVATLAVDDPAAVGIGSIVAKRLDVPAAVRELEIVYEHAELRLKAWLGGSDAQPGKLAGLLRALAASASDGRLYGCYRYRVVGMAGDGRVELQAVRKIAGVPDVAPIAAWPGIAGAHALLAPGAEVLVSFIEGDRAQPFVCGFAGLNGPGFVPTHLDLGGVGGPPAARSGDAVEVLLPPAVIAGTLASGGPFTGVVTWLLPKALGVVTAGSSKVGIGT